MSEMIEAKKAANRKHDQKWRVANPDKVRETARKYRVANPDKERERCRKYRAENPDRIREQKARWRAENPDKTREQGARYRAKNPDKVREQRARWHVANPSKLRQNQLKRKYGLSLDQWDAMFVAQGSKCAICSSEVPQSKRGWSTDHCHTTGKVRGILCHPCNIMLGNAEDNVGTLLAATNYLKRHQPEIERGDRQNG